MSDAQGGLAGLHRYRRNETTDPRMAGCGSRVGALGQRALGLLGVGQ